MATPPDKPKGPASSGRADSTMEVLLDELEEASTKKHDKSVDSILDDLEGEISPSAAVPPPAPRRDPTANRTGEGKRSVPPPLHPRPATGSIPPPPKAPAPRPPTASTPISPVVSPPVAPPPAAAPPKKHTWRPAPPAAGLDTEIELPKPPPPPRIDGPRAAPPPKPTAEKKEAEKKEAEKRESDVGVEALERELPTITDAARRGRLHFEIARAYELGTRDFRKAGQHYLEAIAKLPEHVPSIQGARRALLAQKSYAQALPLFDAESRVTRDPKRRAAIHVAKGRVLEDALGQKAEARAQYAIAVELDRADHGALRALEQSDQDTSQWNELSRTYEKAANAATSDPRHRAALVTTRARLVELRQKDPDAAIELYETALRLDPSAAFALEALERLYHGQRRWRDLIQVLERKAARTEDRFARALLLHRVAHLQEGRLGSRDEAITALTRALEQAPSEPVVLEDLARLYDASGRTEDLVRTLVTLASLPTASRFDRVSLLHRIGTLREDPLGDEAGAIDAYEQVLALDPVHVPTLQALSRLYERSADHAGLLRILAGEAEASHEPRRRAAAHARMAELHEAAGAIEPAIDHHARALTLVAGYPPSFKALTRLYAAARRWRELALLYSRAIETATGENAITYLMKLGAVYEDALDEPAQALASYQRVLAIEPKHLGAIHAIQRAAERARRPAELVDALEREAALGRDPKATISLVHRAGEVLDEMAGDRDGAIARYRRALAIDATYAPALSSLGRLLSRAGRWEELLDLYKRELDLARDPETIVGLRLKMGEICEERIGREDEALAHYRAAVEADPKNPRSLRTLARLLRERSAWDELVRTLERELAVHDTGKGRPAEPSAARARAAHRIAEVREERLNDAAKALALYEAARDADPAYRPAIDAVARLRAADGSFRKLVDELERDAKAATDEVIAIGAWMRAGEVAAEHLGEPKRALAAFDQALEREPGALAALLAIEPLARRTGAFDVLARTLASLARTLTAPEARVAVLRDLARLEETKLGGKPESVRATYEAILSLAPDDPAALTALERIAIETGDRALLASIDERLAETAGDPAVAAAHRARLAETLLEAGDSRALPAFGAAVAADPDSLVMVRGLRRAAELVGDAAALADALRREARLLEGAPRSAALLVRAGTIAAETLVDMEGAYADFERALELDPENADAPGPLLEILLSRNEAGRAADRLGRAALSAKTPTRVAALSLEVARLQAEVLGDVAGGIATLVRARKSSPADTALLRALARLYAREAQWPEAAETLRSVIALAPPRDVGIEALLDLAGIELDRLNDLPRAVANVGAVLTMDAENLRGLSLLARLEERAGHLDKAAEALKRLASASRSVADRAAAFVELARLEQSRGDDVRAFEALSEAVAIEGPYGPSGTAFRGRLAAGDVNGWSRYAQALYDHLRRQAGDPRHPPPASVYVDLAEVLSGTLGRHEAALEVLREAMRGHDGDADLARRFAQQALKAGRPAVGLEALRRLVDLHPSHPELARELAAVLSAIAPDTRVVVLQPLVVLGAATSDEEQRLKGRPPALTRVRASSFGPETMGLLYRLDFGSPALGMMGSLPEAIVKLYPADLEGLGVGRGDRLTARSGHPLRALADRIGTLLSAGEFELYVHRVRGRGVAIELSEPVSILVPAAITELPEPGQVFLLARALANASLGLSVFDKLTPRELEVMLAAAARLGTPHFGAGLTSEEILDDQSKRIGRALSRKARRMLDEILPRYVAGGTQDLPSLARSVSLGAARTAALLADDLPQAIEALRRTERDYANGTPSELAGAAPLVSELVRFWTSDVALDVRRRAGLLP